MTKIHVPTGFQCTGMVSPVLGLGQIARDEGYRQPAAYSPPVDPVPMPCDTCRHYSHCAATGDECDAWDAWVGTAWSEGKRAARRWHESWRVPRAPKE